MSKEIVVRLKVPDWVDEEKVKKRILVFTEELIESGEQTVEEARRFYGVKDTTSILDVPEGLEREIYKTRRKRSWQS